MFLMHIFEMEYHLIFLNSIITDREVIYSKRNGGA
jgi:hypothetical protein